ncbi:unnamed protein product [Ixodes persulcatus]
MVHIFHLLFLHEACINEPTVKFRVVATLWFRAGCRAEQRVTGSVWLCSEVVLMACRSSCGLFSSFTIFVLYTACFPFLCLAMLPLYCFTGSL